MLLWFCARQLAVEHMACNDHHYFMVILELWLSDLMLWYHQNIGLVKWLVEQELKKLYGHGLIVYIESNCTI